MAALQHSCILQRGSDCNAVLCSSFQPTSPVAGLMTTAVIWEVWPLSVLMYLMSSGSSKPRPRPLPLPRYPWPACRRGSNEHNRQCWVLALQLPKPGPALHVQNRPRAAQTFL